MKFETQITRDAITKLRADGSEQALKEAADLERELEDQQESHEEAEREEVEADLVPPGSPAPVEVETPAPPESPEEVAAHAPDPDKQGQVE